MTSEGLPVPDRLPGELFDLAVALVAIPSTSRSEARIADALEADLRRCSHLRVERIGDSLVARTELGRARRVVLAGHLDTVPASGNAGARVEGDVLYGLGSVDMKGGIAVLVDLARSLRAPDADITYIFYACEEVDHSENALAHLARERPELIRADAAVLCEPTGRVMEAGCQGTMRVAVRIGGRRAHSARPWMGSNAIHRTGGLLSMLASYEGRHVVIDGCEYAEQLQAVKIEGGVAGNVVPDEALVVLNYRFAPDRSSLEAETALRSLLGPVIDTSAGDAIDVLDAAEGAPPSLSSPLLAALRDATSKPPKAKVGWTDVATFHAAGVPAANFGPGDPALAHSPEERVTRSELVGARKVLAEVLGSRF